MILKIAGCFWNVSMLVSLLIHVPFNVMWHWSIIWVIWHYCVDFATNSLCHHQWGLDFLHSVGMWMCGVCSLCAWLAVNALWRSLGVGEKVWKHNGITRHLCMIQNGAHVMIKRWARIMIYSKLLIFIWTKNLLARWFAADSSLRFSLLWVSLVHLAISWGVSLQTIQSSGFSECEVWSIILM